MEPSRTGAANACGVVERPPPTESTSSHYDEPASRGGAGRGAGQGGVETRSRPATTGATRPDGAQPHRSSERVRRGRATPSHGDSSSHYDEPASRGGAGRG